MNESHIYLCIDLKSFYASVECVHRKLDPLTSNLVVADTSRTDKTICLAVSPSLKSFGLSGRARLFEVVEKVKQINEERRKKAPHHQFLGTSIDINMLSKYPELALDYIAAIPRMATYISVSTQIYNIYLKYVSKDDIHVYSIDEVFMDITHYLKAKKLTPEQLAMIMIKDVYQTTGITATAGIGTNMYLAKVAMDIVAKHIPADENGVRIASLDEMSYRKKLWSHRPLKDFWRVGKGYVKRLEELGLFTMGDIARCSLSKDKHFNEDLLYKEFGINAELLIDHAWGYEPTEMKDIKNYKPSSNSLSSGQVLSCPYSFEEAKTVIKEMVEDLSMQLIEKKLMTDEISLLIGYDSSNLNEAYEGEIKKDYLGRDLPKGGHGAIKLSHFTSSSSILRKEFLSLYEKNINPLLSIRRINVVVMNLQEEEKVIDRKKSYQPSLFSDIEKEELMEKEEKKQENKEKKVQEAILKIKAKYGKNSILKGTNYLKEAKGIERNKQIRGHKA